MSDKEAIDRWATYIIPTVFKAETKLQRDNPEWKERLQNVTDENAAQVAEEYCRAITTEIVTNAADADRKEQADE